MPLNLPPLILYLITEGATTPGTTPASEEFERILSLISAAVAARLSLVQIREKNLSARVLYELTTRAARLTKGSDTRLLVNDRADIARAAGADGVHLTTQSLEAMDVRRAFGTGFLIGVSTHTLDEARAASVCGADFATFGPIFETPSKRIYGPAIGLENLNEAARALAPFPLVALGGVTGLNASQALCAGARGVAAIRLFSNPRTLDEVARAIRNA
jgi:thiamine-phosphate pyrophosphorylase